jgi:hypothetical protein
MQDGSAIQPGSGNRRPGLKTGIWAAIAALFLLSVGFLGWQFAVQGTDQSLTSGMRLGCRFHACRSQWRADHPGCVRGAADAALFRLHPLPGSLSDHTLRDGGLA